jgi:hypothetical protein
VPLLSRVLPPSCLTTLVGRRLKPGLWPEWDVMLQEVVGQQQVPLLVMFPGPGETGSGGGGVHKGEERWGGGCEVWSWWQQEQGACGMRHTSRDREADEHVA